MEQIVKVKDSKFRRGLTSKALLNSDHEGLAAYKDRKKVIDSVGTEKEAMKNEINTLRGEVDTLKSMIQQLIDRDRVI